MMNIFLIFAGGGLGSLLRFGLASVLQPWSRQFPWATLAANGLACTILGAVLFVQMKHGMPESRRLFLATGLCGGFSTFSTFTAECWQLIQQGQFVPALLNVALSLALCFLCLLLGAKIAASTLS